MTIIMELTYSFYLQLYQFLCHGYIKTAIKMHLHPLYGQEKQQGCTYILREV